MDGCYLTSCSVRTRVSVCTCFPPRHPFGVPSRFSAGWLTAHRLQAAPPFLPEPLQGSDLMLNTGFPNEHTSLEPGSRTLPFQINKNIYSEPAGMPERLRGTGPLALICYSQTGSRCGLGLPFLPSLPIFQTWPGEHDSNFRRAERQKSSRTAMAGQGEQASSSSMSSLPPGQQTLHRGHSQGQDREEDGAS